MELKDLKFSVVGLKQVMKSLDAEELETVYLADDTELNIRNKVLEKSRTKNIPVVHIPTMKMLGEAAGIEVKASVAGVRRPSEGL